MDTKNFSTGFSTSHLEKDFMASSPPEERCLSSCSTILYAEPMQEPIAANKSLNIGDINSPSVVARSIAAKKEAVDRKRSKRSHPAGQANEGKPPKENKSIHNFSFIMICSDEDEKETEQEDETSTEKLHTNPQIQEDFQIHRFRKQPRADSEQDISHSNPIRKRNRIKVSNKEKQDDRKADQRRTESSFTPHKKQQQVGKNDQLKSADRISQHVPVKNPLNYANNALRLELPVSHVQFGSLPGKGLTPLTLQNSVLRIGIECSFEMVEGGKKKRMNEKYKLALSSIEVDKITLNCEREPLLLCVVPSKRYSEVVKKALTMNVIDAQSEVAAKQQIIFVIQNDSVVFKKCMEQNLPELQKIAPIGIFGNNDIINLMHKITAPEKVKKEYNTRMVASPMAAEAKVFNRPEGQATKQTAIQKLPKEEESVYIISSVEDEKPTESVDRKNTEKHGESGEVQENRLVHPKVLEKSFLITTNSATNYKIPKISDRMKQKDGKKDEQEPSVSTSQDVITTSQHVPVKNSLNANNVGFELPVSHVQFGSLPGLGLAPLTLQNSVLRIEIECSFEMVEGGKKKRMNEKYKLALSSVEVDEILIKYEREPLLICVTPSKGYCELVNKDFEMNIFDTQSNIPTKRQITFVIKEDAFLFKKLMEQNLPEFLQIAKVVSFDNREKSEQFCLEAVEKVCNQNTPRLEEKSKPGHPLGISPIRHTNMGESISIGTPMSLQDSAMKAGVAFCIEKVADGETSNDKFKWTLKPGGVEKIEVSHESEKLVISVIPSKK
eukprot:Seg1188.3 transcript_id=Seg1188.3/GoldUCD/mRNA.D3Y31 product="hypothetical protein" protein_id=Seg1188.3/GoldUCD/D3Y31